MYGIFKQIESIKLDGKGNLCVHGTDLMGSRIDWKWKIGDDGREAEAKKGGYRFGACVKGEDREDHALRQVLAHLAKSSMSDAAKMTELGAALAELQAEARAWQKARYDATESQLENTEVAKRKAKLEKEAENTMKSIAASAKFGSEETAELSLIHHKAIMNEIKSINKLLWREAQEAHRHDDAWIFGNPELTNDKIEKAYQKAKSIILANAE